MRSGEVHAQVRDLDVDGCCHFRWGSNRDGAVEVTPGERNAVIDECIRLVRGYSRDEHARAKLRQMMSRGTPRRIPDSPQGMILVGLQLLKTKPPIFVKCEVIEAPSKEPIIVYSESEEENVSET